MKILDRLLSKEEDLLRFESRLAEEVNKLKDLENKVNGQSLEIQEMVKFGGLELDGLTVNRSETSLLEIKEGKVEKEVQDEDFEIKMKIQCKSEIIKVLKEGLSGIFEIRQQANKEINEMRKEIIENIDVEFNLSCREEAECIEDEAEWLKVEIQRITDKAMREFELYLDVICK